jgi:hypothetical protein
MPCSREPPEELTRASFAYTPHFIPTRRINSGARTPSFAATAISSGPSFSIMPFTAHCNKRRRAAMSVRTASCRRVGRYCRQAATCRDPYRPSAAAPNIARSAPCGERTARSRAHVGSTVLSRRLPNFDVTGSGSSPSPTTTSIRRRWRTWPGGAPAKCAEARTVATEVREIRADGAAGTIAVGHGLLHADYDGGRRRRGVPRRHAAGEHQRCGGWRRRGDAWQA